MAAAWVAAAAAMVAVAVVEALAIIEIATVRRGVEGIRSARMTMIPATRAEGRRPLKASTVPTKLGKKITPPRE